MDPGNYGTDIQAGASLNYSLLWVVWLSSGMAMLPSIPIRKTWHSDWPIVTRSYTRKIEKEKIHNTLLVGAEAAARPRTWLNTWERSSL